MDSKRTQRLLSILILVCSVMAFNMGCPRHSEKISFVERGAHTSTLKVELAGGRGNLTLSGTGMYFQTSERPQPRLRFRCVVDLLSKADHTVIFPDSSRAFLAGTELSLEWFEVVNIGDDILFRIEFPCPDCFNFCLDSLSDSDCPGLALDLSRVIERDGEFVPIDTIYARIPERIIYWARRLKTQGY